MRILREEALGLVIDIQERLVPAMCQKEKLLHNTSILLKGFNELQIPLFVTQQYTKGLGETVDEIKSCFTNFQSFEKRDFSCCDDDSFFHYLKEQGKKDIIVCGIEAHVCVLQTVVDLKDNGFNPVVAMDCVSSRSKENIELAKERFRYENIMMTSYESILFELTRSSSAEEFKAISKLVK